MRKSAMFIIVQVFKRSDVRSTLTNKVLFKAHIVQSVTWVNAILWLTCNCSVATFSAYLVSFASNWEQVANASLGKFIVKGNK